MVKPPEPWPDPLNNYSVDSYCIKCGLTYSGSLHNNMTILSKYIPPVEQGSQHAIPEYMERACGRCGYEWKENCLDKTEKVRVNM